MCVYVCVWGGTDAKERQRDMQNSVAHNTLCKGGFIIRVQLQHNTCDTG